jgi:hypothetical protein
MSSDPVQVFIHIPKAAGTSFRGVIERNVPPERRVALYAPYGTTLAQALWAARSKTGTATMIIGHVERRVHEMIGRDCRYFTMLRDPVERVLSLYRFLKYDYPLHPEHHVLNAPGMTLERWIETRPVMGCNVMTKMLSGFASEYQPDTPAMLPVAIKALHELSVLGLQERYAESVDMMCASFGWTPIYEEVNRSSLDRAGLFEREPASEAAVDKIRAANALDVALYAEAAALFDSRAHKGDGPRPEASRG